MRHFKRLKKSFIDDLSSYINTYMLPKSAEHTGTVEDVICAIDEDYDRSHAMKSCAPCAAVQMAQRLGVTTEIILPKKQPTFQQNLFKLIDERGLKDSAVYRKADIDRRLFSKIRSDINYHPSKSTAVKLCLALSLSISETERLLETAGYCLSLSDTADLVVRYFIEHKSYNLIELNEALDYFGQDIL